MRRKRVATRLVGWRLGHAEKPQQLARHLVKVRVRVGVRVGAGARFGVGVGVRARVGVRVGVGVRVKVSLARHLVDVAVDLDGG